MLYRTSSNLDDTLDQCIDRLQGGVDIATCLQENQLLADELKPLLQVAAVLPSLPAPQLSQQARNRIRKQMLQAVKTQEQAARRYERRSGSFFGFAMRFAVVLVVVMLAMGSGVAAAQSSVPGDALYPVKRGSEQVRLAIATRQADRAALHLQLAETRFAEINTLLERGKQPDPQLITDLSGEYDAAWNDIHTLPVADSAPLYAVYVATLEHHVDLIRAAATVASPEQGVQFAATLAASESALVRAHNDEWQNEDQRPTPNTPGVTPGNTGENSGSRPDTPSSTVQPGSNGNNGANQGNNGQNSATPPATNSGNGGQNNNGNNGNGGQNDNNGGSQIGTPPNPNPTDGTNNNGNNNGGQNDNGSQIGTPPNPNPTDGTNNNGNNGNNNGNGGQNNNGNNGNNGQNGNGSQTDTPANPQPGPNPGNNGNGSQNDNGNGSDSRPDTPANPGATDGPGNGNGNNGNGGQNDNGNNGNNSNGGQNDNGNNGNNGNDGSVTAAPQATTEAAPTEAALATAEPFQPTDAPTDSPAENGNNGNGNNGNGNNDNGNGNGGDGSNGQNGNGNNGNGNGRNRP